jgi:glucose/arabinose dehydrogenase
MAFMRATALALGTALVVHPAAAPAQQNEVTFTWGERNTDFEPAFDAQFRAPLVNSGIELDTATVVGGLVHPWGIAILPDEQGYLVTERAGRLRHIGTDGTMSEPIDGLPEVVAQEQGGLLDIARSPDFANDRLIYWTYAKPVGDGLSATAAARGTLSSDLTRVDDVEDIFVQEPGSTAPMHYGSRIVFDDDGHAFVTTGEHFTQKYRDYAQDLDKTYGKVVRINLDGSIPNDNPFVDDADAIDSIWSLGHRNIQGAFFGDGELWTIEHGPKGGDELNLTEAGKNYGWPVVSYGEQYSDEPVGSGEAAMEGMTQPVYFWDPVIAPAGMLRYQGDAFSDWNGDVLISSLYPGGVVRVGLEDGQVTEEERLLRDIGRVRDIVAKEDGTLLLVTDQENGELIHVMPKKEGS